MFNRAALAFLLTFVASNSALAQSCKSDGYPVVPNPNYEHNRWISSDEPGDIPIEYDGFFAMFDGLDDDDGDANTIDLLAIPEWVAHEVKRYEEAGNFTYAAGFKRPSPWYERSETDFLGSQPGVTETRLDRSYSGEGHIWNRGHLATRSLVNRFSSEAGCNSHVFFNAVPQYGPMNSGPWLALERYTGALANKYGRAWAINGPIFYEGLEIETVGASHEIPVAIPHALFKVIVFEIDDDIYVRAYVFDQPSYRRVKSVMATNGNKVPKFGFKSCDNTKQEDFDFSEFSSSLFEIEGLTGVKFFPNSTSGERSTYNEYSKRPIWNVEEKYYALSCG